MKKLLLFFLLLFPALAFAQFTTVSGAVVDPTGLPYAYGTITATLVVPSGAGSPTLNGQAYIPPSQATGLSVNGQFVIQLADNTVLLPASTKWQFLACSAVGTVRASSGTGAQCFSPAPITISGTSQNISAQLNAVAPALAKVGNTLGSKLRRLELAAQQSNPNINLPANAPPAWAGTTNYTSGQTVSNGGQLYWDTIGTSLSPCTSASSGGPTGTGAALITDNTCSWYWVNVVNQSASALTAPVISFLDLNSGAPPPSPFTNLFSATVSVPANFQIGGGFFLNPSGGQSFRSGVVTTLQALGTGVCGQQGANCGAQEYSLDWLSDAPKSYISMVGNNCSSVLYVNGALVAPQTFWTSSSNQTYLIVDYTSTGGRQVRHFHQLFAGGGPGLCNLGSNGSGPGSQGIQVAITPADSIWLPSSIDNIRAVFVSDSYGQVGAVGYDFAQLVGRALGWSDNWDDTEGGSGYQVNLGGGLNYQNRISSECNSNGDIFLIWGGLNDPLTGEQAAVLNYLRTLRACQPGKPIIVFGVPQPGGVGEITKEQAIQAAVQQFNDPLAFFIPVSTDPTGAWITGTGNVAAPTGSGNGDVYISADGTHPTASLGNPYLAISKAVPAIQNIIAKIP